jgi:acetylornithine/succinyldiaminopimelate/putrescine aminotransferase
MVTFYFMSCLAHRFFVFIYSMSTDPDSRGGFGPYLEGVGPTFVDEEGDTQMIRYGVLKDLESALDLYGEDVAAFLVEPIQGEAGYPISLNICAISTYRVCT